MKTRTLLFVATLLLSSGNALSAPDVSKGSWYGTDGTNGTLRGRDAGGSAVSLLVAGAPND